MTWQRQQQTETVETPARHDSPLCITTTNRFQTFEFASSDHPSSAYVSKVQTRRELCNVQKNIFVTQIQFW
jgi:hypothetical protein